MLYQCVRLSESSTLIKQRQRRVAKFIKKAGIHQHTNALRANYPTKRPCSKPLQGRQNLKRNYNRKLFRFSSLLRLRLHARDGDDADDVVGHAASRQVVNRGSNALRDRAERLGMR